MKQKGFTLLELSIVLVLLGVFILGVFKAKELIENAKVKSLMSDIQGITIAYQLFKDNQESVPGDTDQNGLIDNNGKFWSELLDHEVLDGNKVKDSKFVHDLQGFIVAGNGEPFLGKNRICITSISAKNALSIERQLDDGNPETGWIKSSDGMALPAIPESIVTLCRVF